MRRNHVGSLVLLLLATFAPAKASTCPKTCAGPGGHHWVAVKIATDGSPVTVSMSARSARFPRFGGALVYDAQRRPVSPNIFYADMIGERGARIEIRNGGQTTSAGSLETSTLRADFPFSRTIQGAAGTFWLLAFVAADAPDWTYSLSAGSGATTLAWAQGSETFVKDSTDFGGTVLAWAAPAAPLVSLGARAQAGGSLAAQMTRTFVGGFLAGAQSRGVMAATLPSGVSVSCPCTFAETAAPFAGGPGTYTFTVTGAGAGFSNLADVLVGGVDALLPD